MASEHKAGPDGLCVRCGLPRSEQGHRTCDPRKDDGTYSYKMPPGWETRAKYYGKSITEWRKLALAKEK